MLNKKGHGTGVDPEILLYLHDHTSKKEKIDNTPLHSTFKLIKYRKNVKLTIFLTKRV